MRADKDSSGPTQWVIPVGLVVVSLLQWIIARAASAGFLCLQTTEGNGHRRSHCRRRT